MERVTRAEAARRIGVNKATISRWVKKHPALLDSAGLVSVEELTRHRDQVVNPALQTKTAAPQRSEPDRETVQREPTLNDHRSRTEMAKATRAELELADTLKMTLLREDVERSMAEAGETIRQKAGQLAFDKAEALARIDDVRAMERAITEMMDELLISVANALAAGVDDEGDADAA